MATKTALLILLSLASGVLSECPETCTLEYHPVCGSDGETYPNECALEVTKCHFNEDLVLVHEGACVTRRSRSTDRKCPASAQSGICTLEYAPVCASDGNTYDYFCGMCAEMYRQQQAGNNIILTVVHEGRCADRKMADFCHNRYQSGACTREYEPVCGTDGKTYGNRCTFCYAQFKQLGNGEDLKFDHFGKCYVKRQAEEVECLPRMKTGACTREYNPVCASNGKTYANPCNFCFARYQEEENGADLAFRHFGQCKPAVECREQYRSGACTREYFPICGSDGITYGNVCNFCFAKFKKTDNGGDLSVNSFGTC